MGREVIATLKLQLCGGCATPAPPIGPALGQHGVNLGHFCLEFNKQTQDKFRMIVPVVITVYGNKSFTFVVKQPTAACLLKEAAEIHKGSGQTKKEVVGTITQDQLERIAKIKMSDLNTTELEAAKKMIAGTARSMGIKIVA